MYIDYGRSICSGIEGEGGVGEAWEDEYGGVVTVKLGIVIMEYRSESVEGVRVRVGVCYCWS